MGRQVSKAGQRQSEPRAEAEGSEREEDRPAGEVDQAKEPGFLLETKLPLLPLLAHSEQPRNQGEGRLGARPQQQGSDREQEIGQGEDQGQTLHGVASASSSRWTSSTLRRRASIYLDSG